MNNLTYTIGNAASSKFYNPTFDAFYYNIKYSVWSKGASEIRARMSDLLVQ